MTEERCGTCRFVGERVVIHEVPWKDHSCRRSSPRIYGFGSNALCDWPPVFSTDWCGEYEAKPAERAKVDQATCEHKGWMASQGGLPTCVYCGLVSQQKWGGA